MRRAEGGLPNSPEGEQHRQKEICLSFRRRGDKTKGYVEDWPGAAGGSYEYCRVPGRCCRENRAGGVLLASCVGGEVLVLVLGGLGRTTLTRKSKGKRGGGNGNEGEAERGGG